MMEAVINQPVSDTKAKINRFRIASEYRAITQIAETYGKAFRANANGVVIMGVYTT